MMKAIAWPNMIKSRPDKKTKKKKKFMLCKRLESRPRSHIAWPNIILSSSLEIQSCDYLTKKYTSILWEKIHVS